MGTSPMFWRIVALPEVVFVICFIALTMVQPRISPPRRAFLVTIWGSTLLLIAFASVTAALLWASETPVERLQSAHLILLVAAGAGISLVLGIGLAWLVRLQGERFLIAIFRPPPGVTYLVRFWSALPVLILWLALCFGAFAATYGILSYLARSR